MKILVLWHTAWTEMMAAQWAGSGAVEVETLFLDLAARAVSPDAVFQQAKLVDAAVRRAKPAFVVDINGAGILPLSKDGRHWTSCEAGCQWIEWWWDDPSGNAASPPRDDAALTGKNVRHVFWDKTLAEEYSVWFGKKCFYAPTAAHTGAFNPEAEKYSRATFPRRDISFLGTYYNPALPADFSGPTVELDTVVSERLSHPEKTYFQMIKEHGGELPVFSSALSERDGIFPPSKASAWRNAANILTGARRRNSNLDELERSGVSAFFAGDGWPSSFTVSPGKIYQPAELTALFRSCAVNLDLGNGQSFTGANMRVYEIMSAGAVLALGRPPDFDPEGSLNGAAYILFKSVPALLEKIKELKGSPARARMVGETARDIARSAHTWTHRLGTILSILSAQE